MNVPAKLAPAPHTTVDLMVKDEPTIAMPSSKPLEHAYLPGGIVPAGVCIVCKRRPIEHGGFCGACATALGTSDGTPP